MFYKLSHINLAFSLLRDVPVQTIVTGAGDETLRFWNVFPSPKSQVCTRMIEFVIESDFSWKILPPFVRGVPRVYICGN